MNCYVQFVGGKGIFSVNRQQGSLLSNIFCGININEMKFRSFLYIIICLTCRYVYGITNLIYNRKHSCIDEIYGHRENVTIVLQHKTDTITETITQP